MNYLSEFYNAWFLLLPGMFLLETALFVLSIVRNYYYYAQILIGALGTVYSAFAWNYFIGFYDHMADLLVTHAAIYGFVILTAVYAMVYWIVHSARKKKAAAE